MRYRGLGATGIQVSELGFGLWTLATNWWGEHDDASAQRLLKRALGLGVTFFDTADTYGQGKGETLLAELLKTTPRDSVVLSTKFGYNWRDAPNTDGHKESPQDFSVDFVRRSLEDSLRRLNTDYVDIWQLHNPRRSALESDDLFTYLDGVKREGKVRAVGVALGPAIGWRDEGEYALRDRGVDIVQMIYNILEQDPGRHLLGVAEEQKSGLLVRVPHSSGMLEGRYTADTTFDSSDHRSHRNREWLVRGLAALERLSFLTAGTSMTIGQAALRFVVASEPVAASLPNIYDEDQLVEFAAASDFPDLTSQQLASLETLYESDFKHSFAASPQDSNSRPAPVAGISA
ncbi:MAG: aldo/keto reductase [Dehalococcoidia bacterium]|nr:aldo/keto reductase [Dehalococcoidia bacterium]